MTSTQKNSGAHLGAPAQRTQASRKGKRAWRKHVDIDAVEQRLDDRRAEERALGAPVHAQPDAALFAIDTKGDDGVRKAIPRQLKSLAILAERSAVPAVGQKRKAASVPRAEKDRLMRAAGRTRRGPLRSHVDGTELGKGSALLEPTEAVKHSGTYDVWEMDVDEDDKDNGFGVSEMVKPKPVKPPTHTHPSALIAAPAVPTPHAGASYNPPVDAHQELLLEAYEIEKRRLKEENKFKDVGERIKGASEYELGMARGMTVLPVGEEEDDNTDQDADDDENANTTNHALPRPAPPRKTRQQRAREARVKAETTTRLALTRHKRLLASLPGARALRRRVGREARERGVRGEGNRLARAARLRKLGLLGSKIGKHRVGGGMGGGGMVVGSGKGGIVAPDVQLGEELSGSLRGVKPEGNLFRDRLLSMQSRALVEPRVRVIPSKRVRRTVEYEKHAWKRFERED